VDENSEKNGEGEEQPFDLSTAQQGEPIPDESAGGDEETIETAGSDDKSATETDETTESASIIDEGSSGTELPLPLLHELEQEPPTRPPEQPPEEPEAPPVDEEGSGRRLTEQWRIDLKWIFGIPATIVLILTLAVFVLFQVSGEEVAENMIDSTRQQIIGDARFQEELAQVDPELLSLLESDEFAALLYEDPEMFQSLVDAIPEVAEDDPRAGQFDYVKTSLGIYSSLGGTVGKSEHIQARSALIALLLLLALFGIPYVIFSRRLGKIVSVAISLALASWIPLFILMYLRGGLSDWIADRADVDGDYQVQFLLNMVDSFAHEFVDAAMPVYRYFSIAALILLGIGGLGLLVVWWRFDEGMVPRKKKLRDT
jgi:hypothetical protein